MHVELTPQQASIIQENIRAGVFHSPEEFIDSAFAYYNSETHKLEALRAALKQGEDSIARGEIAEINFDGFLKDLHEEYTKRHGQS